MDEVRVVLVDDHQMVRQGLAQALGDCDGIKVVGQAGSGNEALRIIAELTPKVVVLDYGLTDLDGPAVTQRLRRECPGVHVVILTVHDNIHYVLKSMEAGALGFVVKADAVDELVKAIHTVSAGKSYISARLSDKVAQHLRGPKGRHVGLDKLSQREFELLRLMGRGMSLQECALQMKISESTASTYRARLMTKLELGNTAQIIRFAIENGITG
jgi:DNA-binding NarL/FixJ family response regulator